MEFWLFYDNYVSNQLIPLVVAKLREGNVFTHYCLSKAVGGVSQHAMRQAGSGVYPSMQCARQAGGSVYPSMQWGRQGRGVYSSMQLGKECEVEGTHPTGMHPC